MKFRNVAAFAALLLLAAGTTAHAEMRITEWMYNSDLGIGEFVEFTNTGATAVNMSGYSYDDDSRNPGVVNLSAFGLVQPGESVILSEASASSFRSQWNLPASVKVIGGNATNLGRADEINIFSGSTLVDRLTFGDQVFPGSIRTVDISGNPNTLAVIGTNTVTQWSFSTIGDQWGSYASVAGAIGNPGIGNYVVPEPSSVVLMVLGTAALFGRRIKKLVRSRTVR